MPLPHQVDRPPVVVILSIMYVGRTLHSDWYIMKKESHLHQAHCAFPCPDVRLSKSSNAPLRNMYVDEDPRTEGSVSRRDDFVSPEEE